MVTYPIPHPYSHPSAPSAASELSEVTERRYACCMGRTPLTKARDTKERWQWCHALASTRRDHQNPPYLQCTLW